MFKEKPFLLASVIFGGLGLIMLILTVISFFCGDQLISGAICSMLNLEKDAFTDATMAQIAVVLFLPTFIFAYRSFADSDDSIPAVPVPAYAGNVRSPLNSSAVTAESSNEFTSSAIVDDNATTDAETESADNETADSEKLILELTNKTVSAEPEPVISETAEETEPETADTAAPSENEPVSEADVPATDVPAVNEPASSTDEK